MQNKTKEKKCNIGGRKVGRIQKSLFDYKEFEICKGCNVRTFWIFICGEAAGTPSALWPGDRKDTARSPPRGRFCHLQTENTGRKHWASVGFCCDGCSLVAFHKVLSSALLSFCTKGCKCHCLQEPGRSCEWFKQPGRHVANCIAHVPCGRDVHCSPNIHELPHLSQAPNEGPGTSFGKWTVSSSTISLCVGSM